MDEAISIWVVGAGYVGGRLARKSPHARAITRSASSARELAASGVHAVACDLDDPEAALPSSLTAPTVLAYLVPPTEGGTLDKRLGHFLERLAPRPNRFVYLSTTGVYGDTGGGWVDEDTPTHPLTDRAKRRVDAEQRVKNWCAAQGVSWTILRVPGIYGPHRLPLERLQRGDPMIRHTEAGITNRIHVDDLVQALWLIGQADIAANRIYNITDGLTISMTEYCERVARLTGLPMPRLISRAEAQQQLSPALLSFLSESRRVNSQRIIQELGFAPRYQNLEQGILASLSSP
jgi:nucleoside-diphosphate-sugar epimerase